jgi:hypothetical protein
MGAELAVLHRSRRCRRRGLRMLEDPEGPVIIIYRRATKWSDDPAAVERIMAAAEAPREEAAAPPP